MNNLDARYQALLEDILQHGVEKEDRTGTGTISVFGRQIRHKMSEGFPLLTTKKMAIKTMMTELKWFLKGDTNIKFLLDNDCHIWTGDAYKRYVEEHKKEWSDKMTTEQLEKSYPDVKEFENLIKTVPEFAHIWGELGPIYGKQWKKWGSKQETNNILGITKQTKPGIDQIQNLINELKTNPDSRRLMVNAWNVGEMNDMVLPPCHYGFQLYTRNSTREEKIVNSGKYKVVSLMWNQRSVDTFLGLPFNIASYATLLQLIADECDMIAGDLIANLGDVHLYKNHIEQAKEQISRDWFELPTLELTNVDLLKGEFDYEIKDYKSHPSIKAPLSN
jgi:thymidylate synthase